MLIQELGQGGATISGTMFAGIQDIVDHKVISKLGSNHSFNGFEDVVSDGYGVIVRGKLLGLSLPHWCDPCLLEEMRDCHGFQGEPGNVLNSINDTCSSILEI